jgi:hypothetical protein
VRNLDGSIWILIKVCSLERRRVHSAFFPLSYRLFFRPANERVFDLSAQGGQNDGECNLVCILSLVNALPNKVGRLDSENVVIRLSGSNILDEHCYFENADDIVTIHSLPGSVTVRIHDRKALGRVDIDCLTVAAQRKAG